MTLLEFGLLILIAAICGALGQSIAGSSRGGLLTSIVLGFIGAMLGTWLARNMDLPELFTVQIDTVAFPIVWAVIGATLFVALVAMLTRSRRTG